MTVLEDTEIIKTFFSSNKNVIAMILFPRHCPSLILLTIIDSCHLLHIYTGINDNLSYKYLSHFYMESLIFFFCIGSLMTMAP